MNNLYNEAGDNTSATIKVIGIGQSMRGDDGVGLAAVRWWNESCQGNINRPSVKVELAESPGIDLLDLLEGARIAVVVDAMRSGASPGTVRVLTENQLDAFTGDFASAHGWGIAETLSLGRELMPFAMPKTLVLIGIEADHLEVGASLSPSVETALPEVGRLIELQVTSLISV
jgi:hydrogenase maturation protease